MYLAVLILIGSMLRPDEVFPFEEVGRSFQTTQGLDARTPAFGPLLEERFAKVAIGLFDICVPVTALGNKDHAKEFQGLSARLVEVQSRWAHLVAGTTPKRGRFAEEHMAALHEWIDGWKPSGLASVEPGSRETTDLLAALEAKEEVRAASVAFAEWMRSGNYLGQHRDETQGPTLVWIPERETFVGLACYLGMIEPEKRSSLWLQSMPQWTVFRHDGSIVLALQHPAGGDDYRKGTSMNGREQTGLAQQILHLSLARMIEYYYGERMDPVLQAGIPTMLVVDTLGENNARAGGAEDGNSTPARSKFVRGGQSQGGKLAQISADTRWRAGKGKDYFVGVLKTELEEGAKVATAQGASRRSFALQGATLDDPFLISAPFTGDQSEGDPVPDDYAGDAAEFFRAYSCAFCYVVSRKIRKIPSKVEPEEALGALLKAIVDENRHFLDAVQEIYGMPWSGEDSKQDTVEGFFLKSLGAR